LHKQAGRRRREYMAARLWIYWEVEYDTYGAKFQDVLVGLLTFRKSFNLKTPTLANGCITLHYTKLDYFHKNSVFANGYLR
jgi:hypothetical protein